MKKQEDIYVSVKTKFYLAITFAVMWLILSIFCSIDWINDLSMITNTFLSLVIISGVAYIPGFINMFLVISVLFDKQPSFKDSSPTEEVTILIAAYNEEDTIYETLEKIKRQDYNGRINTIVINNNSSDNTVLQVNKAIKDLQLKDAICIDEESPGKFKALNTGLKQVNTKYVITLDADTLLHPKAIRKIVARIKSAPEEIAAVAGSVLVRNSRANLLSKVQEWDYFLSIMSIKRMQGLYQGTLVAQGAFSIYETELVKELGGWSDSIGEDIVLTWQMLVQDRKVYYEPLAVAFTDVPTKFSHFLKQRSRWARGMIEGLRTVKPWNQPNVYYKVLTAIDILILFMDFSYTFFFIPGCILAVFGHFYIVGPFMLLVFPFTLLSFFVLFHKQKYFFNQLGLKVRKNKIGFIVFILFYQIIMSPISLMGYLQEAFRVKRVWD